MGAWIETDLQRFYKRLRVSHPMWVRGLKPQTTEKALSPVEVAPYVGAWIETFVCSSFLGLDDVAPYVGAWIETKTQ